MYICVYSIVYSCTNFQTIYSKCSPFAKETTYCTWRGNKVHVYVQYYILYKLQGQNKAWGKDTSDKVTGKGCFNIRILYLRLVVIGPK